MRIDKIGIIGLGYVGLPLARLFATKFPVVGFDINTERISELISGFDSTLEVDNDTLKTVLVNDSSESNGLFCTNQLDEIKERLGGHDAQLNQIYDAIENIIDQNIAQNKWDRRDRIGFK